MLNQAELKCLLPDNPQVTPEPPLWLLLRSSSSAEPKPVHALRLTKTTCKTFGNHISAIPPPHPQFLLFSTAGHTKTPLGKITLCIWVWRWPQKADLPFTSAALGCFYKEDKTPNWITILCSWYKSHLVHCEDFCTGLLCMIFSIYVTIGTYATPYSLIWRAEGICISLLYDVLRRGTHASPSPSIQLGIICPISGYMVQLGHNHLPWPYMKH